MFACYFNRYQIVEYLIENSIVSYKDFLTSKDKVNTNIYHSNSEC